MDWLGKTSWPGEFLNVEVDADKSQGLLAESKTCFQKLILPVHENFDSFKMMMDKALKFGAKG